MISNNCAAWAGYQLDDCFFVLFLQNVCLPQYVVSRCEHILQTKITASTFYPMVHPDINQRLLKPALKLTQCGGYLY